MTWYSFNEEFAVVILLFVCLFALVYPSSGFPLQLSGYHNCFFPFNPLIPKWLECSFSSLYHLWIKHWRYKNGGNDHWLEKLWIFSTNSPCQHLRKCMKTVWRIWTLMLERKGFISFRTDIQLVLFSLFKTGYCKRRTTSRHCCVFPFIYKGRRYNSCTRTRHSRRWCAITPNYDRDKKWGNCVSK